MGYETILYRVEDAVAWITLNRPEKLNAFDDAQLEEFGSALKAAERDGAVRAVVVTGAGRAFCSGQDLAAIRERYQGDGGQPSISFQEHLQERYNPVILCMRRLEKPILGAINGVAAGAGLSVALSCDLRLASDQASFIAVFVRVGLVPDSGTSYWLSRLVGPARAFEMATLGEGVDAERALQMGLVNRVVPAEELESAAREWASRLARGPTRSIGYAKRLLNYAAAHDLEATLAYEAAMQELAGRTEDHRQAVLAFLEKRKYDFQGR